MFSAKILTHTERARERMYREFKGHKKSNTHTHTYCLRLINWYNGCRLTDRCGISQAHGNVDEDTVVSNVATPPLLVWPSETLALQGILIHGNRFSLSFPC